MSFYDLFSDLCKSQGMKPGRVATELGINRSNVTNWKNNGYTPRGEVLQRIADYFDTTVDYLLGRTDYPENSDRFGLDISDDEISDLEQQEKTPTSEGEREISDEDIKLALFGGDGEVTDEMWDEALFAVQLIKERHRRKQKDE